MTETRLGVHARPDLGAVEFAVRHAGRTIIILIDTEQAMVLIGELLSAILDAVRGSGDEPSRGL